MRDPRYKRKEGAAIVESSLVIILLCLILFGLMQVSYLIMSRDVISFSAFASARALAVGMNEEFVERVARTTSIPSAGPPTYTRHSLVSGLPDGPVGLRWDTAVATSPGSQQFWYEHDAISWYLGADDESMLDSILNYCNWRSRDTEVTAQSSQAGDEAAEVTVRQQVPLAFPFARAFFHDSDMGMMYRNSGYSQVRIYPIEQTIRMENHSELYLTTF